MIDRTLDRGWAWVILFSCFGVNLMSGFIVYGLGVIHIALLEHFREDVGKTSWIGALTTSCMWLIGPISGILVDRFNCRIIIMLGALLTLTGFVMSALLTKFYVLFLTYGIIVGSGAGMAYTATMIAISYNFQRKRNIANGIAVTGSGFGMIIGPTFSDYFLQKYGLSGTFLLCGAIAFHMALFGALHRPSTFEIKNQLKRKMPLVNHIGKGHNDLKHKFKLLKDSPFVILCVGYLLWTLGNFIALVHTPAAITSKGFTDQQASFFISLMGIGGTLSRTILGFVSNSDNIDEILLYFGCLGITSLVTLTYPLINSTYTGNVLFALAFGTYISGVHGLLGPIVIKLVGIESMATAFGYLMFAGGIGGIAGPPLAGMIIDYGGTYEHGFILAGLTFLAGSFSGMLACSFHSANEKITAYLPNESFIVEKFISTSSNLITENEEEKQPLNVPDEISRDNDAMYDNAHQHKSPPDVQADEDNASSHQRRTRNL